jgi:hypothetical protein
MVTMGQLPEESVGVTNLAGPRVTVQLESLCAGARFELTGIQVVGTMTPSGRSKEII